MVLQAALSTAGAAATQAADTASAATSALQAQLSAQFAVLLFSAQLVNDVSAAVHEVSALAQQDPRQQCNTEDCAAIAGLVHLSPNEVHDLLSPPMRAAADCRSSSKASELLHSIQKHGSKRDSHDLDTVRHLLEEDAQAALLELGTIKQQLARG